MSIDSTQIVDDIEYLIAEMPTNFTHGVKTISGFKSMLDSKKSYYSWGADNEYQFTITALLSDFTTIPQVGDIVTVGTTEYRIIDAETISFGYFYRLHLGGKY